MGADCRFVGVRPVDPGHVDAAEQEELPAGAPDNAGESFSGVGPCQISMPISTISSQISSAWQSQ